MSASEPGATRPARLGTSLLVAVAILVLPSAGLYLLVTKTHPVYQASVRLVTDHPRIRAAVGIPVRVGWLPYGKVWHGGAVFRYGVSGPRGAGDVEITGTKKHGAWRFRHLWLKLDDGRRVNLGPKDLVDFAVAGEATPTRVASSRSGSE